MVALPVESSERIVSSDSPPAPVSPQPLSVFQVAAAPVLPVYVTASGAALVQPSTSFPLTSSSGSIFCNPGLQEDSSMLTNLLGKGPRQGRKEVNSTKDNLPTSIKEEEDMESEHVIVMPFLTDFNREQTPENLDENVSASSSQPQNQTNKPNCKDNETEQLVSVAQPIQTEKQTDNTGHKNLKELTQLLVELNNKNLQCDQKIQKLKEEFEKKVAIIEAEKKANEKEIDKVLLQIQNWKDVSRSDVHVSSEITTRSRKKNG